MLNDNAASETESIALSGTGITAEAVVSPTSLQFGSIAYPGSASKTLTITNPGSTRLTVSPSSDGPSTTVTASTCGAGVGPGKSCTLQVEFKPDHLGPITNSLKLTTNSASNPVVPVSGTATGVGSPTTKLDFGTVKGRTHVAGAQLTVFNYGVKGNVTVQTETGAVSFHIISNACALGITEGSNCLIEIEYKPLEYGTQTAYLKLIPSTGPTQTIVMTGTLTY